MNITESGARLQEYIKESKEKKEMIEKEIREGKDKEIEQLKKAGNKQDDKIYKLSCDVIVKDEENKRLREEKEFLLRNYSISKVIPIAQSEKEARNAILKAMQQAPEEK